MGFNGGINVITFTSTTKVCALMQHCFPCQLKVCDALEYLDQSTLSLRNVNTKQEYYRYDASQ